MSTQFQWLVLRALVFIIARLYLNANNRVYNENTARELLDELREQEDLLKGK